MKMRHLWRWPVLCSMLFGLAAAGTAAGVETSPAASGATSQAADPATRVAQDPRLHGRMVAIRAGLLEARRAQYRPAALRTLATQVEGEAGLIVEEFDPGATHGTALQGIVADLYAGADALRHASKSVRSHGLKRLNDALQNFDNSWEIIEKT